MDHAENTRRLRQRERDEYTYDEYDDSTQGWYPSEAALARQSADHFAGLLTTHWHGNGMPHGWGEFHVPPQRLSASDLHSRVIMLEGYARACRVELQRRPSHCREVPPPQPTSSCSHSSSSSSSSSCCLLLQLSPDELGKVAHELCDPLRPKHFVHLSSTAKSLRLPMQADLCWLYWQRHWANVLAAHLGERRAPELGNGPVRHFRGGVSLSELELGSGYNKPRVGYHKRPPPLTIDHWRTIGTLIGCGSFPHLTRLAIRGIGAERPPAYGIVGDAVWYDKLDAVRPSEVVALLAAGLRRGGLPSLMSLELCQTQIGNQAASTLSSALTKRTVPKLTSIRLSQNQLGDSGLSTMASALRQLPKLKRIILNGNQIGERGLAQLLLGEPMFESLKYLRIGENNDEDDVTDAGRALLSALPRGSFFCCERSVPNRTYVRKLGWRHATVLEHLGPFGEPIWEQEFPGDCSRFF